MWFINKCEKSDYFPIKYHFDIKMLLVLFDTVKLFLIDCGLFSTGNSVMRTLVTWLSTGVSLATVFLSFRNLGVFDNTQT